MTKEQEIAREIGRALGTLEGHMLMSATAFDALRTRINELVEFTSTLQLKLLLAEQDLKALREGKK